MGTDFCETTLKTLCVRYEWVPAIVPKLLPLNGTKVRGARNNPALSTSNPELLARTYPAQKSFCISQFKHKFVNLSFIVKDKFTDLWGS